MREEINWDSAFRSVASITGLPLQFSRGKWYGACYINGEKHARWNKTVVYIVKDGIRVLEQGGDNMSLLKWLVEYGGCLDWASAYARIRSECGGFIAEQEARTWVEPILKYVDQIEVGLRSGECNLFKFLVGKFGSERVEEVWDKYCVGSKILRDGSIGTVFWYLDSEGRCCHDKVMLYGENGRRDKVYGGGRKYKVADGYRGKCYFGSHCMDSAKRTCVVESEKSALGLSLIYPECNWIATGGANMLREIGEDWVLMPDNDLAGKMWESKYPNNCKKWYCKDGVDNGDDFFDLSIKNIW